ncbi:MAG: class I SAM-dependent methyltransferase [Vicingaceae bacterium]
MSELLINCRLCNSSEIVTLKNIKSPHIPYSYMLYKCNSCNSKFFNPKEHPISLDKLYEDFANDKNKSMLTPTFVRSPHWEHQKNIINKLLNSPIKSVLDIGCRTGDFLMHFDEKVKKEGVELSKEYSKICKDRGLTIYSDFVENIDFNQKYDTVSCYALLEHIVEPITLINDLKKLVDKNGLLVILVPWHECLKEKLLYKLNIQWHMFSPPEHLNFFSKKILNQIVTKDGNFKLVKYEYTSGGIFNPFKNIPVLGKGFSFLMRIYDKSFMNKLPIFDHIFLYYQKIN